MVGKGEQIIGTINEPPSTLIFEESFTFSGFYSS
jgi:hypothetical protein